MGEDLAQHGEVIRFLQCWDPSTVNQERVTKMKETIQTLIKDKTPNPALPYIEVYPFNADSLHDDIKRHAFHGSLPTVVNIAELDEVLHGTSPRGALSCSK